MLCRLFEGRKLYAASVLGAIVADMGNAAYLGQPVKHDVRAVLTIVGKDDKMIKAHCTVMGQPFEQKCALVSDAQDGDVAHATICV